MNRQVFQIVAFILLAIPGTRPAVAQSVRLNEVQYVNRNTLTDADGDSNDWIELHNPGSEPVDLRGYFLSDDSTLSDTWALPDLILQSGSYLLIHASGNIISTDGEIHADFKLGLLKDPVILIDPMGSVVDRIDPQCVPPDKTLGQWPDGSGNFKILAPTPGGSNNSSTPLEINYQKDILQISHPSGMSISPLEVSMTTLHPHNQIYYTLDGVEADEDGMKYEKALVIDDISGRENRFAGQADGGYIPGNKISKATILRARVFSEGCPAGDEVFRTYFINPDGRLNYPVPVISLITEGDNLFDEESGIYVKGRSYNFMKTGKSWERPVHVEFFDSTGNLSVCQNAGMRIHGWGSRYGGQKSLRLYARREYGEKYFEHPFFPQKPQLSRYKRLLLRTSKGWSRTLFKDDLCHALVRGMDVDLCATQPVVLFLNGEYWGIYSLRERHDRYYIENNHGIDNDAVDIIGLTPDSIEVKEGTRDLYEQLISTLKQIDPLDDSYLSRLEGWFDLDNLMDVFIAQFYLANMDFPQSNHTLWRYRGESGRWRYFFYDLDGTMSRTYWDQLLTYNSPQNDQFQYKEHSVFVLTTLLKNKDFRRVFFARYEHHLRTTFAPERVMTLIDTYERLYGQMVAEQIYRWNEPGDLISWYHNVDMLKAFAMQRPAILFDQLDPYTVPSMRVFPNPVGSEFYIDLYDCEGMVEITIYTPTGKILYKQSRAYSDGISIQTELKPGIYLLSVKTDQELMSGKLIVH